MKKICTIIMFVFFSMNVYAGAPQCAEHSSGNYCFYSGKVYRVYVNHNNLILIYFDAQVDIAHAKSFGMSINSGQAAAYDADENPVFASLMYSTALEAQRTGRPIEMQMRGDLYGYLKLDRIWLTQ